MKTYIFTLILSIFFATHICSAQHKNGDLKICNLTGKMIAQQEIKAPVDSLSLQLSIDEVQNFAATDCDKVIYNNEKGKAVKIANILFAYTYKNGNSNFEKAKGDRLTKSMKDKMKNAVPGDKFMVAVDAELDNDFPNAYKPKAMVLYKIVE